MNHCKEHKRVHAYHDGQLPARRARRLEAHLATCASCRRELQRLRAISSWLAAAPRPAVTAEVLARLRRSPCPGRDRAVLRLATAATAAAAAVLIVCSALLWQSWPRPAPAAANPAEWETFALSAGQAEVSAGQETDDVDLQIARALLGTDAESGYDDED